ncbi:hypothetical protein L207DRAFT_638536 [Hyaloscypha variabilis F]|uniref:Uncharacterized protein n=1 Tax=Hyaloscypha variabilis (strain UAMH 11265 / GT02V1 / F) TaxID=1149755 RepID=A0A2J6R983_HYAVF|nr:hypothetical protein L207DRAFT_638536 [Hyaloscypha variabilis F]
MSQALQSSSLLDEAPSLKATQIITLAPNISPFQDSIGPELPELESLCLKRQRRWAAVGTAKKMWTESLKGVVDSAIDEHHQAIFRGFSVRPAISRTCWMIGYQPENAHPTAVIGCSKAKVLNRLAMFIHKSGIFMQAKFKMMTFCSSIDILYGNILISREGPLDSSGNRYSLCGAEVTCPELDRVATLGGVITLGGTTYGLTVAHVCAGGMTREEPQDICEAGVVCFYDEETVLEEEIDEELPGDIDTEMDDGSSEGVLEGRSDGEYFTGNEEEGNVPFSDAPASNQNNGESSRHYRSNIVAISSDYPLECLPNADFDDDDWALLHLDHADDLPNILSVPVDGGEMRNLFVHSYQATLQEDAGKRFWIATRRGTISARSLYKATSIKFPKSEGFVSMWSVQVSQSLEYGDSGSWVVEAESGILYGMLLATSNAMGEGYIIPIHKVFQKIRQFKPFHNFPWPDDLQYPQIENRHDLSYSHLGHWQLPQIHSS